MTKEEVTARFKAIVAKVDAELAAKPPVFDVTDGTTYDRLVIEGRVMPIRPDYRGNASNPGNLDGRNRGDVL